MAQILSGIVARDARIQQLAQTISHLQEKPTLVIFQVGGRSDSNAYINQKKILAKKIHAEIIHRVYPESITQQELLIAIAKDNNDAAIHGIIVQMPLPVHLNKLELIEAVEPKKDVDGLTSANTKRFEQGDPQAFTPATARGVMSLFDFYNITVSEKNITVIGKSALVGGPIATCLMQRQAHVTVCDKQTGDLIPFTKPAEIIIVAAGAPGLITKKHVSEGQIIIDVGISVREEDGKRTLMGDVAFDEVEPVVAAITPVPGGVGPMTVASLFENLVQAYLTQH